jgi:hypothetical protein
MSVTIDETKEELIARFCQIIIKKSNNIEYNKIFDDLCQLISQAEMAKISHNDIIKILEKIIKDIREYCPNKKFRCYFSDLDSFYEKIYDVELTYEHLLAYHRVLTQINFIKKPEFQTYGYNMYKCLFVPTLESSPECYYFPRLSGKKFVHLVLEVFQYYRLNKFSKIKNHMYPITEIMLKKGMDYFNYPIRLQEYITDPPKRHSQLILFYIGDNLCYDGPGLYKKIKRRASADSRGEINLDFIIIEGKKYSDYINVNYHYYIGNYDNRKPRIIILNKFKLRGFLNRGFRVRHQNGWGISLHNYFIPMELPWRDEDD